MGVNLLLSCEFFTEVVSDPESSPPLLAVSLTDDWHVDCDDDDILTSEVKKAIAITLRSWRSYWNYSISCT